MPRRLIFCILQPVMVLLCMVLPGTANAQVVKKISESELKAILNSKADTLHIINFWATWCKPCVKELPYFEQIRQETKNSNVKVVLISVDFPEDTETRLKPFAKARQQPEPVLLMDPINDQWISELFTDWSGAIPATVIYNKRRNIYFFAERELTLAELQKYVSLNTTTTP